MTNFPVSYQIRLLALLCLEREFLLRIAPSLEEVYFTTFVGKWLFKTIVDCVERYKILPTPAIIENEYLNQQPDTLPEEKPLYDEFLVFLRKGDFPERTYVRETATNFVAARKLRLVLSASTEAIEQGDIQSVLSELRVVERDTIGSVGREDSHLFSLRNLKEIYETGAGIQTGIGLLDTYVGGLFPKELTIILANTNVGKSLLMTCIGSQALKAQRKVLHVTLEMSLARTLIRYFTTLTDRGTGLRYNNILRFNPPEEVFNLIMELREKFEKFLELEELPTGKGSFIDIQRMVDRYQPELLIVDYLDLIKPVKRRDAKRFELSDLTAGLRGIAMECGIAVLTATQASRLSTNRRIIGVELTAEDYDKARIADVVIGVGQSRDDMLKREVILYLAKSRNTEKGRAERYLVDYTTMSFHLLRQEILGD